MEIALHVVLRYDADGSSPGHESALADRTSIRLRAVQMLTCLSYRIPHLSSSPPSLPSLSPPLCAMLPPVQHS